MDSQRTHFYLFPKGDDFEVRQMNEVEALSSWNKGERFVDMAKNTRSDAEELRNLYLNKK
jgi:hypothetical protein